MKINKYLLLIIVVLFTSCYSVSHLKTDDVKQKYPATNPEQIEVYSTDRIGKNYIVIGEVLANADAGTDASVSVEHLKKEAAKLGADAIINLKLEKSRGFWIIALKASGTAVKFKNK